MTKMQNEPKQPEKIETYIFFPTTTVEHHLYSHSVQVITVTLLDNNPHFSPTCYR